MELVGTCLCGSGLLINGVIDLREKQVSLWITVLYGIVGIFWRIYCGTLSWNLLAALVPGAFCLIFAKLTGEKIGYGDGFMLLAAGCHLDWRQMLFMCMAAITCAGIVALILCLFFHKGKNYEIPFVPFLFLGYMMERWLI